MMNTVVGLFQDRTDQNRTYAELQSQGFSNDQMHVIEEASQFRNYMDCSYGRSMLKNTIASAAFIGSIFALIGRILGAVIGWAEVDRETHTYLAGLEKGHTLMLVQTAEEDNVTLVQSIFKKGNAEEVQVCTRAHDSASVQNKPQLELA